MNEVENNAMVSINMLSALVSYPLFDQIYGLTGDIDSLGVLLEKLGELIAKRDVNEAFLLFQHLMAIARIEIPLEVRTLSADDNALSRFIEELFLDLDDYYTEELCILQAPDEVSEDDNLELNGHADSKDIQ